jgi:alkylated DNA repair dioxygenase AlkB
MDTVALGPEHHILLGRLPPALVPDPALFDALWALHPEDKHLIQIHGREVETPRWQQAYGADYHYTGTTNRALPLTAEMEPFLAWARERDERMNGLLFNWYDGREGHYIGAHRDSEVGRHPGSDIVTISLGEARTFRMRPWKGKGFVDFPVPHGSVLVIPWETNRAWTHEVPPSRRAVGQRISITVRAFR